MRGQAHKYMIETTWDSISKKWYYEIDVLNSAYKHLYQSGRVATLGWSSMHRMMEAAFTHAQSPYLESGEQAEILNILNACPCDSYTEIVLTAQSDGSTLVEWSHAPVGTVLGPRSVSWLQAAPSDPKIQYRDSIPGSDSDILDLVPF